MSEPAALDLDRFKEETEEEFDRQKGLDLYHAVTTELSKAQPNRDAYEWVKKNRPKIYARVEKFEIDFENAMNDSNMKEVKAALDGVRGAWLHGFREWAKVRG